MNQTVKEIAQMLANRAEDVCRLLVPGGRRNGAEWESGSVVGEKGKSCKVRLTGDKVGIWSDFATGEAGDLIDLWSISRNVKTGEAIRQAKEWLGIREPRFEPSRKVYSKPKAQPAELLPEALRYLKIERKLAEATISQFKVGVSRGGGWVAFPYYSQSGELLNVKHLCLKRDEYGKKIIQSERGCAPALFGWQAFKGGRAIAITEGEIDAMTLHQYGMPALSVPFGAGKGSKNDWIDYEWDNLAQFETIYLCYDNDDAGQGCVEEIAKRLGIHRCKNVKLHFKDANECLQNGAPEEEIFECVKAAKTFDPPEIRSPLDFRDKVQNYFYPIDAQNTANYAPAIFNQKIGFRPGELTVWTGCNSHGKSVMLGQLMLGAAILDKNVAIASMEMKPEQTLGRMIKQFWASKIPSPEEIDKALEWMAGKIWIYDMMGNVATSKLLELVEFSVRRHRVCHFVIDSLMKCDVGGEDYDGQRRFLNEIATFSKTHGCHIHLIAHPRKHDEEKPIGRVAISGSGDISNQADNVVSVWRNKAKERGEKTWTDSDAIVLCDKQRETGWEGYIDLEFYKGCEQYVKKNALGSIDYHKFAFKVGAPTEENQSPCADVPTPESWDQMNLQPTELAER